MKKYAFLALQLCIITLYYRCIILQHYFDHINLKGYVSRYRYILKENIKN